MPVSLLLFLVMPFLVGQTTSPDTSSWSATFDPSTPDATNVQWTLTLSAMYCGGYAIGDGVYISPEAPLALPSTVSPDGVLFAGGAAVSSLNAGVLQVAPAPDLARSMICSQGPRTFTIELLPSLGLTNPDAGTYAVDVRIGSASPPVTLPVTIQASADVTAGCTC